MYIGKHAQGIEETLQAEQSAFKIPVSARRGFITSYFGKEKTSRLMNLIFNTTE